jgi:diguanylate cyclase (GGDEF)-like protein
VLEDQFERDSGRERSYRLWLDGLIAIAVLNGCLLGDYLFVKDASLHSVVLRTALVTPIALAINLLMRWHPPRWIREGSVALGTTLICVVNLYAEGGSTAVSANLGMMSVLITALFVNVVMRLRFFYAAASTAAMLACGVSFAVGAVALPVAGKLIGVSMMALGVVITLVAGYGLERQERLGYLLFLRSELQGEELRRLSNLDKLTELPNRRAFEDRFAALWADAAQEKTPLSVILLDVDHFKMVNDVYGHLYGDEVLRRIAGLLPQALRAHKDFAARFGGEEFVILLPELAEDHAILVAERVRTLVEMAGTPVIEQATERQLVWTTISCGVSTCLPNLGGRREDLLKSADRALYQAKANGRNRVEFAGYAPGARFTLELVERVAK